MTALAAFLSQNELFLLALVIVLGLFLGHIEVKGVRLGIAGVLFAGLGLSAWVHTPEQPLHIAPEIKEFGLVLFVYCVGLTSAPGFFSAFRNRGLQMNLVVLIALGSGACVTLAGGLLFGLDRGQMAGVFSGALTNTPALGAATDRLVGTALSLQPVLAYSITYPFGVLGGLLAFRAFAALRKKQMEQEKKEMATASRSSIASINCRVENPELFGKSLEILAMREKEGIVLSRLRRGEELMVPTRKTVLEPGDVVTAVGSAQVVERALTYIGPRSEEKLEERREHIDMRRILVSKRELVGRRICDLHLGEHFNAQITRLRRADLDIVPSSQFRLELGDRLRVVAPRKNLNEIAKFFGDSERELASVDYIALGLGLALGLLLARVPIPVFGTTLSMGFAGGPLVMALILGRLGRTGRFTWAMPYETNTSLRELGLLLFLAGVGVSAGSSLSAVMNREGLALFAVGAAVTLVTSFVSLSLLHFWLKCSLVSSLGATSGVQTQPANLAAAYEMSSRSEGTYVAYAVVYPVAMITKILLAQMIALLG